MEGQAPEAESLLSPSVATKKALPSLTLGQWPHHQLQRNIRRENRSTTQLQHKLENVALSPLAALPVNPNILRICPRDTQRADSKLVAKRKRDL
jgi:hypothetical protein